jgi:hypothetical protein
MPPTFHTFPATFPLTQNLPRQRKAQPPLPLWGAAAMPTGQAAPESSQGSCLPACLPACLLACMPACMQQCGITPLLTPPTTAHALGAAGPCCQLSAPKHRWPSTNTPTHACTHACTLDRNACKPHIPHPTPTPPHLQRGGAEEVGRAVVEHRGPCRQPPPAFQLHPHGLGHAQVGLRGARPIPLVPLSQPYLRHGRQHGRQASQLYTCAVAGSTAGTQVNCTCSMASSKAGRQASELAGS